MARGRCASCDRPADARGAGGVRRCFEHLGEIVGARPVWLRLPDPQPPVPAAADPESAMETLRDAGALSPELEDWLAWVDGASFEELAELADERERSSRG